MQIRKSSITKWLALSLQFLRFQNKIMTIRLAFTYVEMCLKWETCKAHKQHIFDGKKANQPININDESIDLENGEDCNYNLLNFTRDLFSFTSLNGYSFNLSFIKPSPVHVLLER